MANSETPKSSQKFDHELKPSDSESVDKGSDSVDTISDMVSFWDAKASFVEKSQKIKTRSDSEEPRITGLCFLSDGGIVICDNSNSKIKLLDASNRRVKYELFFQGGPPYDVAVVDDTMVVVSVPSCRLLQYVHVKPGVKMDREIDVKSTCYGVVVFNNEIFVCTDNGTAGNNALANNGGVSSKSFAGTTSNTSDNLLEAGGIRIFSQKGQELAFIPHGSEGTPKHICLNDDGSKIYYTGGSGKTSYVTCITRQGYGMFSFTDAVLQCPSYIAIDSFDNLLVCDSNENRVHIIKVEGERNQLLLDQKKDLPRTMTSICFDRRSDMLVVAYSADSYAFGEKKRKSKLKFYKLAKKRNLFLQSVSSVRQKFQTVKS